MPPAVARWSRCLRRYHEKVRAGSVPASAVLRVQAAEAGSAGRSRGRRASSRTSESSAEELAGAVAALR